MSFGSFGMRTKLASGQGRSVASWLAPSDVLSTQAGTIALAAASATGTGTITPVSIYRTLLSWLGTSGADAATNESDMRTAVALTNATTVTATRGGTAVDVVAGFTVTQYISGAFRTVTRGTIALAGAQASNTATVPKFNTSRYRLELLGFYTDSGDPESNFGRLVATNSTTITYTRGGTTGALTVSYQLTDGW